MNAFAPFISDRALGPRGSPPPEPLDADVAALARHLQHCAAASDTHAARQAYVTFFRRCLSRRSMDAPLLTHTSVEALVEQLQGCCGFAACSSLTVLDSLV
ncbi:hypothetical protein MNEG_2483 [Monoraphidium neglectum]|jgi:hypothetical protein|uniref:Uncharacterized protein n=1 Tax=Monoraphidium neglectum TaxID=145388 RepID=A0A0D2LFW0_9CHLO|nr:hypothetical protein MNEG_2483 [Monoraphidium neglectum]KIZ05474.1 hypothetical protein MNEG_2483 [Monoraphidium neglectum]|eukprot:XP_013904493.1 hypothetical protein MNEG_2483 [Monoraphidium neglectum]